MVKVMVNRESILKKYKSKRVLADFVGEDAWKKLGPLRVGLRT